MSSITYKSRTSKTIEIEKWLREMPTLQEEHRSDLKVLMDKLLLGISKINLSYFGTEQDEKNVKSIFETVNTIVLEHQTDLQMLGRYLSLYKVLSRSTAVIKYLSQASMKTLVTTLVDQYKAAWATFNLRFNAEDDMELIGTDDIQPNVELSLKQISEIYYFYDLGPFDIWDSILKCVELSVIDTSPVSKHLSTSITECAVSAFSCAILTSFSAKNDKRPHTTDILSLKEKLKTYMEYLPVLLSNDVDGLDDSAFFIICDLLICFSKMLADTKPYLARLIYKPNEDLQVKLKKFAHDKVNSLMNVDEEIEEEETRSSLMPDEERFWDVKSRRILRSYCRIVTCGVVKMHHVSDFFAYCIHKKYKDVVKFTIQQCLIMNKKNSVDMMMNNLFSLFEKNILGRGVTDFRDESFREIRELAGIFADCIGKDKVKHRHTFADIHQCGIQYGIWSNENDSPLRPPHIMFFAVLHRFSSCLLNQDKKTVLQYLEKAYPLPDYADESEEFEPLLLYHASLGNTTVEISWRYSYSR